MMGSPAAKHIRTDIEGLRAVAVLAVVIHHVRPFALRGGFCGVDIFFVISGYLIGMHLLQDIQAGQLSFLKFYARRARRLFPALVVVLMAVWVCGWIILTGPEFVALGKHIAASTVFANNFLLSSQSGYFDAPSTAKPLLHLWSLGVEEQFYLLVPLLLWLGSRGRHGSVRWVVWLSVLSLLITVGRGVPSFYLLDTRFWELGAGVTLGYLALRESALPAAAQPLGRMDYREVMACALVLMFAAIVVYASKQQPGNHATVLANSSLGVLFVLATGTTQLASVCQRQNGWLKVTAAVRTHRRLLREAFSAAGFAAIGLSLFTMTSADWPGPQTLIPVLGSALIISAGPDSRVNRVLSLRPLVFLGGISYPLYLWHWPIIVFWRLLGYGSDLAAALLAIAGAVLLAWLTRDLVEGPARFGRLWGAAITAPPVWVLAGGLAFTGLLGLSAVTADGYPYRYSPSLRALANLPGPDEYEPYRENRCYFHPGTYGGFSPECTPPKRPAIPRILLWGDSHAAHLYPGLLDMQKKREFDLIQWTSAGCPPTRTHWVTEVTSCEERRAWELQHMERAVPDTALLAARWDLYISEGTPESDVLAATLDDIQWLQRLGVRKIILFGPGPTWNSSLATELVRYMRIHSTERIPERLGAVDDTARRLDAAMAAQALAMHVQYVSVLNLFCNREGCRTVGDVKSPQPDLLFWDSNHLTTSGSRFLVDAAAPQIFSTAPID